MVNKYINIKRLDKEEQERLFVRFAKSLSSLKSSVEAGRFIRDLLTEQEVLVLARRLQVADLLLQGLTYQEIAKVMKVAPNTIAKVQLWLNLHGEGFRMVIDRTREKVSKLGEAAVESWRSLKKKSPMYFWPEILLEELIKTANKRERERLRKIVSDMKDKTRLNRSLVKLLA